MSISNATPDPQCVQTPNRKSFKCHNECQHKLIVLVSTLNFMNNKFKKYQQSMILKYFNDNLQQNGQIHATLKRLQKYLKRLETEFKVTINYYQHLGKNLGTEIRYTLKYSKKECHNRINKFFTQRKLDRFQTRVKTHNKKITNQRGSVVKGKCLSNNSNNNIEDRRDKLTKSHNNSYRITRYLRKCEYRTKLPSFILNLKISDDIKINHLRNLKRFENDLKHIPTKVLEDKLRSIITNYVHNPKYLYKFNPKGGYYSILREIKGDNTRLKEKQEKLLAILKEKQTKLVNEGYNEKELGIEIKKIYNTYKDKPHFIVENNKYKDLDFRIARIKKTVTQQTKEDIEQEQKDIKSNIFSILLEQLRHKVDTSVLIPALKKLISNKKELVYSKIVDNTYYYELLSTIEKESPLKEINIVNGLKIKGTLDIMKFLSNNIEYGKGSYA
ncbi:plasmid maintenance protein [Candidatus Borreliella tachyglossi]|uniref:plasmid maintenance protein n=1 Tax=Candidatus Borreliella tachyglossi TaxID=1964448 RepID=UPI0040435722